MRLLREENKHLALAPLLTRDREMFAFCQDGGDYLGRVGFTRLLHIERGGGRGGERERKKELAGEREKGKGREREREL